MDAGHILLDGTSSDVGGTGEVSRTGTIGSAEFTVLVAAARQLERMEAGREISILRWSVAAA
jgi:hypothetical protein